MRKLMSTRALNVVSTSIQLMGFIFQSDKLVERAPEFYLPRICFHVQMKTKTQALPPLLDYVVAKHRYLDQNTLAL